MATSDPKSRRKKVFRKDNPWFAYAGYEPNWIRSSATTPLDASKPASISNQTLRPARHCDDEGLGNPTPIFSVRQSWVDRSLQLFWPILAPAILAAFIFTRPAVQPVPSIAVPPDTIAVEVERESDESSAQDRVNKKAPEVLELFDAWNHRGGRYVFGPRNAPEPYYLPLPRRGFESVFKKLEYEGFSRLKLFVVHVPLSWDDNVLDLHRYRWAASCGIRPEWIAQFSSFRPARFKKLVDECHVGGTCVIVSFDCRGDAFDDVR